MNNLHGQSISRRQPEHNSIFFAGLAQWISALGFAPVLSIPAFAAIILTERPGLHGVAPELFVSILFGFLFPSIAMYAFVKIKGISYDNRQSRLLPLLSVAAVYFTGVLVVHEMALPINATVLMLCYGTNTLMIYLISLKWKISVHAMGVAGPASALIFSMGAMGGILGLLMLPVVWSRLYMGKHTPAQVASGGLLGYALTSVQFYLIETFIFHESVGVVTVVLLIAVLTLPFIAFAYCSSSRYFRFWFILTILFALFIGYFIEILGLIAVDYLLASNLILFMALLFLPGSENSGIRIVQNLIQKRTPF